MNFLIRFISIALLLGSATFAYAQDYTETGECSYYTDLWQGRMTSSGEPYDRYLFTAAHRTLPYNTLLKVTNLKNDRSCVVRIIDRGPYIHNRILDLSGAAARELGMMTVGVIQARIEYVGMADADSVKAFMATREEPLPQAEAKQTVSSGGSSPTYSKPAPVQAMFYDQSHQEVKLKGFGVQIGTYKSYSSCKSVMDNMASRYGAKVYMYVAQSHDQLQYRLLLGQFVSVTSAQSFREAIRKDHPDSFIVTYSSM